MGNGHSVLVEREPTYGNRSRFASVATQQKSWIMVGHRDPLLRRGIAGFLHREGHKVHASGDGLQMLEWIGDALLDAADQKPPDLIVMEIDLPGRRGIDLLSDLRAVGWDTPFILLARAGVDRLIRKARTIPSTIVFERPFELADLYTAVGVLLDHRLPPRSARIPAERRATPRAPARVWGEELTERAMYLLRVENISLGGLRLRHPLPRTVGDQLYLRLVLPTDQRPIEVASEVVCVEPDRWEYGVGARFLELAVHEEARIATYVHRWHELPAIAPGAY